MRVHPPKDTSTLEGFVVSRFGWRLYGHFFKTQSEKVWGVPCTEIQADWGAQRIKNLSLFRAVWEALKPKRVRAKASKSKQVTSLIEEFNYPKYGPGMMWERCAELVTAQGTKITFDAKVTKVEHHDGRAVAVTAETGGASTRHECTDVISSMPIGALLRAMDPPPPADVIAAADALRYRDFITVALVVPESVGFPDNWIYINDKSVEVGRIQNFGQWSPYMVKDGRTCLGLEFFVNEGDHMWTKDDADLVEQGTRELHEIGLLDDPSVVEAGFVVRMPKAYPMYDADYKNNVARLAQWIAEHTAERVSGRTQRHAPLQQPGPFDAHRDALRREHLRRPPRRLERQRRRGVPRGKGRRAASSESVTLVPCRHAHQLAPRRSSGTPGRCRIL